MRSIAIVMVLGNHYFLGFFISSSRVKWGDSAAGISTVSFLSIEWLFVLSGFLIGTMMIRSFEAGSTWSARARDFWLRRWFRTLPNYYLFLLINVLLTAFGISSGVFSYSFIVFSQNLAWPESDHLFFGEAWSLALDEWFYFLMPILLGLSTVIFRFGSRGAFLAVAATLIILPSLARWFALPPTDIFTWDSHIRRVTIFHLDATGWGVLSAIFSRWFPDYWASQRGVKAVLGAVLTVLGLLIVELLVWGEWPGTTLPRTLNLLSLTLPAAGAFFFLPWLTQLQVPRGLINQAIDRISLYSYSLYLCHVPSLLVVKAYFSISNKTPGAVMLLASVTWLLLTLSLSAVIFHFFEKPTSDLRERFTRKINATPF